MCFGNNSLTSTQNQNLQNTGTSAQTGTQTAPLWLQSAGRGNVNYAGNLQQAGFQPYTGEFVAPFSGQQQTSFGLGSNLANAVAPASTQAGTTLSNVMTGAANEPTVTANSISSQMSPYMNQYVNLALQPQLAAQQNQQAINQQLTQGQATSAGAFGDPRATMIQQNEQLNNNLANESLVGNAYNAAFNTAIGAGAQDVANKLAAQTTNAGLYNTGLQTQLGAANTALNQGASTTNLVNALGGQQTAASQAQLNALYNQWLLAQQYPFQTTQLMNSTIGAALPTNVATTSNGTTSGTNTGTIDLSQPNNAGYGILGSLLGGLGGIIGSNPGTTAAGAVTGGSGLLGLLASDPKLKEGAKEVGKLYDGTPVHSFAYKSDPTKTTHIGVMAPEVKKKTPGAVHKVGAFNYVDYKAATKKSAQIAHKKKHDGLAASLAIAA